MQIKAVGRLTGETLQEGALVLHRAALVEERPFFIQQAAADGGGDGEGIHHLLGDIQIKGEGRGRSHVAASVVEFCHFQCTVSSSAGQRGQRIFVKNRDKTRHNHKKRQW